MAGWSVRRSSATILRAVLARSVCVFTFMPGGGRANARRGEHALALDLDHAHAAIAVRPIAGLRRVAEVRQLDVEAARGAEDRLAFADVDLAVVDEEGVGLLIAHISLFLTNAQAAW